MIISIKEFYISIMIILLTCSVPEYVIHNCQPFPPVYSVVKSSQQWHTMITLIYLQVFNIHA